MHGQKTSKFESSSVVHSNFNVTGSLPETFRNILKYSSSYLCIGRGSSVGIATCYGLGHPGIEFPWGARFSTPVQTDPGGKATGA